MDELVKLTLIANETGMSFDEVELTRLADKTGLSFDELVKLKIIENNLGISIEELINLSQVANETGMQLFEIIELRNIEKNRIERALVEKEKRIKKKMAQEKIRGLLSINLNVDSEFIDLIDNNSRFISSEVKKEVYVRDKGVCSICGSDKNIEYDHILPFSKGGSSTEQNIQLLCLKCNREKHSKIL